MQNSFIFYGTLTDKELLHEVCGTLPIHVRYGFIMGRLYKVTDYTEPNGVYSYPLAVLCNHGHLIPATFNTFEISEKDFEKIQDKLTKFEGPLYTQVETCFYETNYSKRNGLIFVAKKDIDINSMPHVQKIDPVNGICGWR